MAGVLKIICTPIGNQGDLSQRAKEALLSCSLIMAEDTRHSRKLAAGVGVMHLPRMVSCDQRKELARLPLVLSVLESGQDVGLISDAGAPGVSDPGGRLVDAVVNQGYSVQVFPGPSAVIAALMGAGLVSHRFCFLGFLPKKGGERERLVRIPAELGFALVIFDRTERVEKTLANLFSWVGPRRVVVARELTKKFETFHRGVLGQNLNPPLPTKGEAVIVVEGE